VSSGEGMTLFEESVWQMSFGERAAIEGVLSALQPDLAIEVGTAEGACLQRIARHAGEVHSFDLVEPSVAGLGSHVHLHTGDSHELLPQALAGFADAGRNVDFVLVDGDHSPDGVRRDMEALLASPAVGATIIIAHDTGNERVRAGLDAVPYDAWPKVAHVDLDFVPGHLGRERFPGELWYGLGLVVVAADRQAYGTPSAVQAERHHGGRLLAIARDVLAGLPLGAAYHDARERRLGGEIAALRARVGELEGEVAHHRSVVNDVTTSASWRVSAPLRTVKHLVARRAPRETTRPAPRPPAPDERRPPDDVVPAPAARDAAPEHPEWLRRLRQAREEVLPWIEQAVPLAGLTVLEYGCGQGAVSCAVAEGAGRHIGFDVDPEAIALAHGHMARREITNSELFVVPETTILDAVRAHAGEIDVFLLYAVLEHLTIPERLAVLALAREVTRADGHIVVCETPNRLIAFDHHTGQMPFLHALPRELAERYYSRSPRADFVTAVDAAATAGPEALRTALTRWGDGVSFHELELTFGDLVAHTVASNYDPLLYPGRPVRREEVQLASLLDAWRPDLPPCWSRTWIDTVLSVKAQAAPPVHVRPWQMELGPDVEGVAWLADGRLELRAGARLPVRLPVATDRLHVELVAGDPAIALQIHTAAGTLAPTAEPNLVNVPQWHAAVRLPEPTATVELSLRDGGCLTFVGYAGAADPAAPAGRAMSW